MARQKLRLIDFIDRKALREIQESFSSVVSVAVSFRDEQGKLVIPPSRPGRFCKLIQSSAAGAKACALSNREAAKNAALGHQLAQKCHAGLYQYVRPIELDGRQLGTLTMGDRPESPLTKEQIQEIADRYELNEKELGKAAESLGLWWDAEMDSRVRLLSMLSNNVARICYQEYVLRERLGELGLLYDLTDQLSGTGDLDQMLKKLAKSIVQITKAKACSLRILNQQSRELEIKARYGFSREYLTKGPVKLSESQVDLVALSGEPVHIVDMASDPRVLYGPESRAEGLVSGLALGLIYKGQAVGVLHLYTAQQHKFGRFEVALLRTVASAAAAAIENARLYNESLQTKDMERQIRLASAVQRQMTPQRAPDVKGLDLAGIYIPCLALAGDFYDYLKLPDGKVGIVLADVSGKGVAASLHMASTRATLRAQIGQVSDIREIVRKVNEAFCEDMNPADMIVPFASMFYAVLDPVKKRMSYVNAGHEPPLLLRQSQAQYLTEGGPLLGLDVASKYDQGQLDLQDEDVLVVYTDGLVEAMNFKTQQFGSERVLKAARAKSKDSAKHIAKHLLWEMRRFAGLAERIDDITIVVAKIQEVGN